MEVTNKDIFNAMVDSEWSIVFYGFKKFISLYKRGQELGCLPEQPTKEQVDLANKKFEELMKALDYV